MTDSVTEGETKQDDVVAEQVEAAESSDDEEGQDEAIPEVELTPEQERLVKLGWMKKKGGGKVQSGKHMGNVFARKNWKERWFVMRGTIIKYYKFQTLTGQGGVQYFLRVETSTGWLNITHDMTVVADNSVPGKFFLRSPQRTFEFIAPSTEAQLEWVDLIERCIATLKSS